MRTDPKQSDENREEAGLEEALKLWMEIRQVDRKKGWERLEAEIGRQYGLRRQERRRRLGYFRWLAAAVILCFGIGGLLWLQSVRKPQTELLADWDKQPRLILEWRTNFVRRGAGSEAGRRKQEFCDRSPEKKYRLY